jgi:hypothetical protein
MAVRQWEAEAEPTLAGTQAERWSLIAREAGADHAARAPVFSVGAELLPSRERPAIFIAACIPTRAWAVARFAFGFPVRGSSRSTLERPTGRDDPQSFCTLQDHPP